MTENFTVKLVAQYKFAWGINLGLRIEGPSERFPVLMGCSVLVDGAHEDLPGRWLASPGMVNWEFYCGSDICEHRLLPHLDWHAGSIIFALWEDETFTNRLAETPWESWIAPRMQEGSIDLAPRDASMEREVQGRLDVCLSEAEAVEMRASRSNIESIPQQGELNPTAKLQDNHSRLKVAVSVDDIDGMTAVLSRYLRVMNTMLDRFEPRRRKGETFKPRVLHLSGIHTQVSEISMSMLHVNTVRNLVVKEAKRLRPEELLAVQHTWAAIEEWYEDLSISNIAK